MVLQGPGLHQLEERWRALGQKGHHLPEAGPLDLAGLACAALGMGRPIEAGQDFEVSLVLAGSVTLGVAAAGPGTIAGLALSCGHLRPPVVVVTGLRREMRSPGTVYWVLVISTRANHNFQVQGAFRECDGYSPILIPKLKPR